MKKIEIKKSDLEKFNDMGYTAKEIAAFYNCSIETVKGRFAEYGLSRKYFKEKDRIKLIQMAKIYSVKDIAKICNCDIRTVYYWLNELGITAQANSKEQIIEKEDDVFSWKKEILKKYGVWASDDDKPGTKGIDCRDGKHCRKCFYSGGNTCNYLIIAHEKRGCSPWNCDKYKKGTYKDKMEDKSRYY